MEIKGRVLLMDDEESILHVTGKMLKLLGYEVSCARHGAEAVELYAAAMAKGEPYDLIIMDLTIRGGLGGKATINALRQINPKVKAIVSSGYSHDPIMADHRKHGFCGILAKPYRLEDLSEVLGKIMGR